MSKLKVNHYVVGPVQTNCYFAINEETKELLVIDPGASAKQLAERIRQEGCKPVAILLTHGHFDHATGAEELAQDVFMKVFKHLSSFKGECSFSTWIYRIAYMMGRELVFHADKFLKDEQEIDLAGFHIRVLHTPGHTPGGCCYYFPYEDVVFTGDSLFCGSIGRTDFKGGSSSQLVLSRTS